MANCSRSRFIRRAPPPWSTRSPSSSNALEPTHPNPPMNVDRAILVSPMNWKPRTPDDLIGQAARVAKAQVTKAKRLAAADPPTASMKLLLYGPPGVGKTSVVEMVARELTGSALAVE